MAGNLVPLGAGVLDRAYRRGKLRDIEVGNARSFLLGASVKIISKDGKEIRGSAKVSMVDERFNIVKLDRIPEGTEPGDVIVLGGSI